jgi:hypothetical protein
MGKKVNERNKTMMRGIVGLGVLTVCMLNLWGCANTQPTHFYLLRAMDSSTNSVMVETKKSGVSLGLGPISFPKYLDRPHIVTRISSHEIDLAEFHKWAEPLEDNVANVLDENLSALLSTDRIVPYPWKRSNPPDYQLSLDVIQLDGQKNQEAVLKVRWTLVADDGKRLLQKKTSQFSEILRGSEYEDLVEAMSRMLASFSQEIADAINTHSLPSP